MFLILLYDGLENAENGKVHIMSRMCAFNIKLNIPVITNVLFKEQIHFREVYRRVNYTGAGEKLMNSEARG